MKSGTKIAGGAPINIGTFQGQDAEINSAGGNISIEGVEGNTLVVSEGGVIKVICSV